MFLGVVCCVFSALTWRSICDWGYTQGGRCWVTLLKNDGQDFRTWQVARIQVEWCWLGGRASEVKVMSNNADSFLMLSINELSHWQKCRLISYVVNKWARDIKYLFSFIFPYIHPVINDLNALTLSSRKTDNYACPVHWNAPFFVLLDTWNLYLILNSRSSPPKMCSITLYRRNFTELWNVSSCCNNKGLSEEDKYNGAHKDRRDRNS